MLADIYLLPLLNTYFSQLSATDALGPKLAKYKKKITSTLFFRAKHKQNMVMPHLYMLTGVLGVSMTKI